MHTAVERQGERPHVVVGQDVGEDLQCVADQDAYVLADDRVVEAGELAHLADDFGVLDGGCHLAERHAARHVGDGEFESHDGLDRHRVAVLVVVHGEQPQRARTQLLNLTIAVVDAGHVVAVGVKFVCRSEQHLADDDIDDLCRHVDNDLVALHVEIVEYKVCARLHVVEERVQVDRRQELVFGPLGGVLVLQVRGHGVGAELARVELVRRARTALPAGRHDLAAEVQAHLASRLLDDVAFLARDLEGELARIRPLPFATRRHSTETGRSVGFGSQARRKPTSTTLHSPLSRNSYSQSGRSTTDPDPAQSSSPDSHQVETCPERSDRTPKCPCWCP